MVRLDSNGNEQWLNKANICFSCRHACGGCSWSRDFIPIPGWTASEVVRRETIFVKGQKTKKYIHTYHITECPLYEEG